MIIAAINSRFKQTTHKYGIKFPRSINEDTAIDCTNGNTYWTNAINLKMSNIGVEFEVLGAGLRDPPGWRKPSGHIIVDVKIYFTCKCWCVKDVHWKPDPLTSSYNGIVSRQIVRIALTYADLLGIEKMAADIRKCIPTIPKFSDVLNNMWPWVWNQECWKSCSDTMSPLWKKNSRKGLLGAATKVHDWARIRILESSPCRLVQGIQMQEWRHLLWVRPPLCWRLTGNLWSCIITSEGWDRPTFCAEEIFHRSTVTIFGWQSSPAKNR